MIVAILSGKPNTMVVGARNLLESEIHESSKPEFPELFEFQKHELLEIPEEPEIPEFPYSQLPPPEIIINRGPIIVIPP